MKALIPPAGGTTAYTDNLSLKTFDNRRRSTDPSPHISPENYKCQCKWCFKAKTHQLQFI